MANNKAENVTVPLTSYLNMNQNQSVISNTSDMFNENTGHIFGGNIHPLFMKQSSEGSALYDKHGSKWQFQYDRIEKDGTTVLSGGSYYFDQYELKDFPYPIDQAVIRKYNNTTLRMLFGYVSGRELYVGSASVYYAGTNKGKYDIHKAPRILHENTSTPSVVTFRFVKDWSDGKDAVLTLKTNRYNGSYTLVVQVLDGYEVNVLYSTNSSVTLSRPDEPGKSTNNTAEGAYWASTYVGSPTSPTAATATPQIIVSAPFKVEDYYGITNGTPNYETYRGVTVLNKKQTGLNGHKHTSWWNGLYNYTLTMVRNDVHINPCVRTLSHQTVGEKDGAVNYNTNKYEVELNKTNLGIFCDDSTIVYIADWWHETRLAKGTTDENFIPVSVDLSYGAYYSDPHTNDYFELYKLTNDRYSFVFTNETSDSGAVGSSNHMGIIRYNVLPTLVTNQRHHRFTLSGSTNYQPRIQGTWMSWMVDNMAPFQPLAYPGTTSTMTLPNSEENGVKSWSSPDASDKSIWYRRDEIDAGITNNQGSMARIGTTNWRVLFNYKEGYVSGISYFNDPDDIGTLVTQWDSINDDFFIDGEDDYVYYKNTRSQNVVVVFRKDNPYNSVDVYENNVLQIVADRYVVWNTNAYWNCYDIETGKVGHWGSDWNNRILFGKQMDVAVSGTVFQVEKRLRANYSNSVASYYISHWNSLNATIDKVVGWKAFNNTATTASGVDVAYLSQKTFTPSKLEAFQAYQKIWSDGPQAFAVNTPKYTNGLKLAASAKVDFFFKGSTSSTPTYLRSFNSVSSSYTGLPVTNNVIFDGALEGVSYPVTSSGSAYYNFPIVGLDFISSYAGKYGVKMGETGYSLVYDGVRPVGLYNSTSMIDELEDFFIIQSQYYAIVNDYICAISYSSSSVLNGIEQIVNVNGMQFIGAFPSCAYFFSPAAHAIFAFTGDADLKLFVQTDKISKVYWHLYAPNNEWIYFGTDYGIYVMTQNNIFRISWFDGRQNELWRMFPTDGNYNILEDKTGNKFEFRATYENNGGENMGLEVRTAFFGPGDMKQSVIDCWYVKFFKPDNWPSSSGTVTFRVDTITDKLYKGDQTTVTITTDDWDENGGYLYRYQPGNQMAQGSSLRVTSPFPINYIGYSLQPDNTTVTPKKENQIADHQVTALNGLIQI